MHDADGVRRREAVRDLDGVVDGFARGKRAAVQRLAQRLAVEELGHDVRRAVGVADVVDGKDVRVIQRRCGACFLLEASHGVGPRERGRREYLDRDGPVESNVRRTVYLAHAARREKRDDSVRTQGGAGGESHGNPLRIIALRNCAARDPAACIHLRRPPFNLRVRAMMSTDLLTSVHRNATSAHQYACSRQIHCSV